MIILMKNVNNFQVAKVQVLLSICLTFCQFQSRVAYKSVDFKKTVYVSVFSWYLKKRNQNFMIWLTPQAQVVKKVVNRKSLFP